MVFPYQHILRNGKSRFLPLVPITLHGPHASIDVVALLDSGAEHNVFHSDLAQEIGISLENESPVTIIGVAEQEAAGYLAPVELALEDSLWTAPAIFSSEVSPRPILGQIGFFAFFTVTFRYQQKEIEIKLNQS